MVYKIVSDEEVKLRNVKILVWGGSGTRKTEMAVRFLPDPLVIDSEFNARHVKDMPGVPDFQLVETGEVEVAMEVVRDAIAGRLKAKSGSKVQTVSIDSIAKLKEIKTDAQMVAKDKKAQSSNYYDPDKVMLTLQDRGKISAPLKRLIGMVAMAGVPWFVVVAREKNVWTEVPDPGNPNKLVLTKTDEVIPDGINNKYEFNLIFHFSGLGKDWRCTVDKTQGAIGTIFPVGSVLNEKQFAEKMELLRAYANDVRREEAPDMVEEGVKALQAAELQPVVFTKTDLAEYKTRMGVGQSIGEDLQKANLPVNPIDPTRKQEYLAVVDMVAARLQAN